MEKIISSALIQSQEFWSINYTTIGTGKAELLELSSIIEIESDGGEVTSCDEKRNKHERFTQLRLTIKRKGDSRSVFLEAAWSNPTNSGRGHPFAIVNISGPANKEPNHISGNFTVIGRSTLSLATGIFDVLNLKPTNGIESIEIE